MPLRQERAEEVCLVSCHALFESSFDSAVEAARQAHPRHPTGLPGGAVVAGRLRLHLECPSFPLDLGAVRGDVRRLLLGRPPERHPDERGHGVGRLGRFVPGQ